MRLNVILFAFLGILLFHSTSSVAQVVHKIPVFSAKRIHFMQEGRLKDKFTAYTAFKISSKDLSDYCKSETAKLNVRLKITDTLEFDLKLERSNLVDKSYKLHIRTENATNIINSKPDFLFRGTTKDGGVVRLAIKENFISGSIHESDKEYFIEPLRDYLSDAGYDDFVCFERGSMKTTDVICGVGDLDDKAEQRDSSRAAVSDRIQSGACKTVKIFNLTDYSVFQHYGKSIEAVEDFLLANLNNVEGVYAGFNFNSADASDVGNDFVKFQVTDTYISTCATCDLVDSTNSWGSLVIQLHKGLFSGLGYTPPFPFVPHYWTRRELRTPAPAAGAAGSGIIIMRHLSDDPLYLRLVAAHETGHYLGCQHDDQVKSDVLGFIMHSTANRMASRFSTLADFGGVLYSSNLAIKNTIETPPLFSSECLAPVCEDIMSPTITVSTNGDSCRIAWVNNGTVTVDYKLQQDIDFNPANSIMTTENTVLLTRLNSCSRYMLRIRKVCSSGIFGPDKTIFFSTALLDISNVKAHNFRSQNYDASFHVTGTTGVLKSSTITIDHNPVPFNFDPISEDIYIENLFADGARHRIDITDSKNKSYCLDATFYQAPYYRQNSTPLLVENFNNCDLPFGWTDSISQIIPSIANRYSVSVAQNSTYTNLINSGSIDSTCFAFLNDPSAIKNGKIYFVSPTIDFRQFANKFLSFDYNFVSFKSNIVDLPSGSFHVEAFNGTVWKTIFQYQKFIYIRPQGYYMSVWDTLPSRKFISLDEYSNPDFKIRFVLDDGSEFNSANQVIHANVLLGLDNIRVDAYPSLSLVGSNSATVFPNPASDEIYVRFAVVPTGDITYKIIDFVGREYKQGVLLNGKIDLRGLNKGVYCIAFYNHGSRVAIVKTLKL